MDNDGVGIFEGSVQYNPFIYLRVYGMYIIGMIHFDMKVPGLWNLIGDSPFYKKRKKVLIIEYRHVAPLCFDTKASPYNGGDVNFQQWFWENGDIEVRFESYRLTPPF